MSEIIRSVPKEKLEEIELEAEATGNVEASELVGEELYRRALAHLAMRGVTFTFREGYWD